MARNLSILFLLVHLSFSLADVASSIWTEDRTDIFADQQTSMPDERESQESQETKELKSEYYSKHTNGISDLCVVTLSTERYLDLSIGWITQSEDEIQTPPPDYC